MLSLTKWQSSNNRAAVNNGHIKGANRNLIATPSRTTTKLSARTTTQTIVANTCKELPSARPMRLTAEEPTAWPLANSSREDPSELHLK